MRESTHFKDERIMLLRHTIRTITLAIATFYAVCPSHVQAQCETTYFECDMDPCDSGCCDAMGCGASSPDGLAAFIGGLAENGIILSGDFAQHYQGVVSGGLRQTGRYGGLFSYGATLDFGKLGLTQGTLLQVNGQSSIGESINGDTGATLLAANAMGLQPAFTQRATSLTDFLLTQFLSENFAVFAGRLNTFGGDMNAFAHGRGKTQFMHTALAINPTAFRVAPYVTYGAGFSILKDLVPIFSFSVIDPNNYSTRLDLDELFNDGVTLTAESRLPVEVFGRPGHVLVSGNWSNRTVINLNEIARIPFSGSLPIPVTSDSWAIFGNFDHYLATYDKNNERGWGIFGRWGVADEDSNPIEWFLSTGVGGNSRLLGREQDTFGLGWFYAGVSDSLPGLIFPDDSQGVEGFYGIGLSERIVLSPDAQWTRPSGRTVGDTWTLGMRLYMTL